MVESCRIRSLQCKSQNHAWAILGKAAGAAHQWLPEVLAFVYIFYQLMDEAEHDMKNYANRGGSFPPKPYLVYYSFKMFTNKKYWKWKFIQCNFSLEFFVLVIDFPMHTLFLSLSQHPIIFHIGLKSTSLSNNFLVIGQLSKNVKKNWVAMEI